MTNNKDNRITIEDIRAKADELDFDVYWLYARLSGWYDEEYLSLYKLYIESTMIKLRKSDNATILKGIPLEKIAFYFLKNGGIVSKIQEVKSVGRWQVDGQGPINKSSLLVCMGEDWCKKIGYQMYMEAKNHNSPITGDEFSSHHRRMDEHECNLGICLSTSGYKISGGRGIATSIHRNTWAGKYHLLLTIEALYEVAIKKRAPLSIFQEVLGYASSDMYANDKELQKRYGQKYCSEIVEKEYQRLLIEQTLSKS